jgi:hypothetical protein
MTVYCFVLDADFLANFSTLMMEAICSYRTLVKFHRTTWHYIPEHNSGKAFRCGILPPVFLLKSFSIYGLFNTLILVNNVAFEGNYQYHRIVAS